MKSIQESSKPNRLRVISALVFFTSAAAMLSGTATETTAATLSSSPGANVSSSPLMITTTSLISGMVGTRYSQPLTATGGTAPYTWQLTNGRLPPGLTLNSATGLLSGIPTYEVPGSILTFQVTDSSNPAQQATESLILVILPAPLALQITTNSLSTAVVGLPYSQLLTATGGLAPYTWHLISGKLPAKLTLNAATGLISGTPQAVITATPLTFEVTDSSVPAQSVTAAFTLTVKSSMLPLTITTTSLNNGVVGTAYSQTLTAVGGTPPYTWQLTGGRLPPGLSLNQTTGLISGTPTYEVAGSDLTFQVTDVGTPQQKATASFALTIASN